MISQYVQFKNLLWASNKPPKFVYIVEIICKLIWVPSKQSLKNSKRSGKSQGISICETVANFVLIIGILSKVDEPFNSYLNSFSSSVACMRCWTGSLLVNTLRPRQNGRRFADDTFKRIFLNENVWISHKISPKFVPEVQINNIPALVQIMAWRRPGDKPLSEPMMLNVLTHICVTRPQWVKTMACRLFDAKPLSKAIVTFHQSHSK